MSCVMKAQEATSFGWNFNFLVLFNHEECETVNAHNMLVTFTASQEFVRKKLTNLNLKETIYSYLTIRRNFKLCKVSPNFTRQILTVWTKGFEIWNLWYFKY